MHETYDSLHKHINKKLLPTEYGGDAGSIQTISDNLKTKLVQRRDWFIDDESYKTNEGKRPGKPKNAEALFGTVGSFRTLDID